MLLPPTAQPYCLNVCPIYCLYNTANIRRLLDLVTPEGSKAELTLLARYVSRWHTHPKMVTNPSANQARRRVTSFTR